VRIISAQLLALARDVRLIPAQFVKPFRTSHKNDVRDAAAGQWPTIRFVPSRQSSNWTFKPCTASAAGWAHGPLCARYLSRVTC
jgi:hypothetical protein